MVAEGEIEREENHDKGAQRVKVGMGDDVKVILEQTKKKSRKITMRQQIMVRACQCLSSRVVAPRM